MPLTTTLIPVSAPVNGYQDGKLAGICQAWGSMAKLAADFGARIKQLREEILDESQEEFAVRWGRARKQVGTWEAGGQTPHLSTVIRVARAQGWPLAIFEEGGPMPIDAVKRPVNRRSRSGATPGGPAPSEAARRYFVEVRAILKAKAAEGEAVSAEVVVDMLDGLWRRLGARPASDAADAEAADVREVEQLSQAEESDQGRSQQSG